MEIVELSPELAPHVRDEGLNLPLTFSPRAWGLAVWPHEYEARHWILEDREETCPQRLREVVRGFLAERPYQGEKRRFEFGVTVAVFPRGRRRVILACDITEQGVYLCLADEVR